MTFNPLVDWRDPSLYDGLVRQPSQDDGDYTLEGCWAHPELPGFEFLVKRAVHAVQGDNVHTFYRGQRIGWSDLRSRYPKETVEEMFKHWFANNSGNFRRLVSFLKEAT